MTNINGKLQAINKQYILRDNDKRRRNETKRRYKRIIFLTWRNSPSGPRPPHYRGFVIILRHTTVSRNTLDECSARRRNLCLTTHNTHKRQTSMPPVGFEPSIPAYERPQTHATDRAATRIGKWKIIIVIISVLLTIIQTDSCLFS